MLLASQQLACAANFEIAAWRYGSLRQARWPLGGRSSVRARSPVGFGCGRRACRHKPAPLRATDTATQLIKLRQAEPVRAVDDDGVGCADSSPSSLDDRRAYQHLELARRRRKGQHDLQSACSGIWPWPMPNDASGTSRSSLRAIWLIPWTRLCTKKTCPPRSISRTMAADQGLVVFGDGGGDRQTLLGWRLDGAQSRTPVRPMWRGCGESAWPTTSRRRRVADLLDALFVCDTKPLFLVHDGRPRFLNSTSLEISRWVPTTTST